MSTNRDERRPLFDIEREQRWRIWLLFALLLAMVLAAVWVLCLIVSIFLFLLAPLANTYGWLFTLRGLGLLLLIALPVSLVYWFLSRLGARDRLLRAMHCAALEPGDTYHQRLANIVEELRLASGSPRIDCVTIPTLGFNAFSFSDLRGGGVVGVTEGALARLSRQQLEAVVAHEFGHILSGSYVTATVSCLLFGIYSALADEMEDAALGDAGGTTAPVGVLAIVPRAWLWVVQTASSVTDAALSRERERQADIAAARYTRDPLSLAEALTIIDRHPAGAGYIPEGLAPLCIRETQRRSSGLLGRWRQTHPPIAERVHALLVLANVSESDFNQQVGRAAEHFERREHWSSAPTPAPVAAHGSLPTEGPGDSPAPVLVPRAGGSSCPTCGRLLTATDYEGVSVLTCSGCGGCLVENGALSRILARRDVGFTQEQQRLADDVARSGDKLRRIARLSAGASVGTLIRCPRCGKSMMRGHYNYEHAVEVDRCTICDVVWFNRDELEVLQMLTERQVE